MSSRTTSSGCRACRRLWGAQRTSLQAKVLDKSNRMTKLLTGKSQIKDELPVSPKAKHKPWEKAPTESFFLGGLWQLCLGARMCLGDVLPSVPCRHPASLFPQATALEPVDPDQRSGDELHRGPASAQHGQIQLHEVQLHPGTLLPVPEPGGEARILPRVSVSWPL